jgi:hypothetical protein
MTTVRCGSCGADTVKRATEANRARKKGSGLYCDRVCAGFARRAGKSSTQSKTEKREYDREYRARNRARLKAEKAAYFQRTYDPARAAEARRAKMPRHVEYCRRPEYRAKKQEYDRTLRAREWGEWGEAHQALLDLEREVRRAEPDAYERRKARGYYLRTTQKRRREDARA